MQPLVVSYSEISAYQKCPLAWSIEWRARWRKPAPPGSALDMGTAAHEVMAVHYTSLMDSQGRDLDIGLRMSLAREEVMIRVIDGHPLEDYLTGMYERYVAQWGADNQWEILGVEQQGEFSLGYVNVENEFDSNDWVDREVRVKWIADLIVRHRQLGGVMVWDHKTCSQLRDDKNLQWDTQLPTYTLGAMLEHPDWEIIGGGHNELRKPLKGVWPGKTSSPWGRRTPSPGLTLPALKEMADNMLATVQEMVNAPERPRYSPSTMTGGCDWCSVRDVHEMSRQMPKEKLSNLLTMEGFTQDKEKLHYGKA